jgi:hypothetical protein
MEQREVQAVLGEQRGLVLSATRIGNLGKPVPSGCRNDDHVAGLEVMDLRVRNRIGVPAGAILEPDSLLRIRSLLHIYEIRAGQQRGSTSDDVVHLADLFVLGDRAFPRGFRPEFPAGRHGDANLRLPDIHRANLLIDDTVLHGASNTDPDSCIA